MNELRVRAYFYTHLAIALYCIACGMADIFGLNLAWITPNVLVFYVLFWSAIFLPLAAGISLIGAGIPHPYRTLLAHIGLGAAQLFLGLLPLVT
jgi:hypothetical protein